MKKLILLLILIPLISRSASAETSGSMELGASYSTASSQEDIYADFKSATRDDDLEVSISHILTKTQSQDRLSRLASESSIQANIYNGFFTEWYVFLSGVYGRYRDLAANYDQTSVGAGVGSKNSRAGVQTGLYLRATYTDLMDRCILSKTTGFIVIPIRKTRLKFALSPETNINLNYLNDWDIKSKNSFSAALNENVSISLNWLPSFKNDPLPGEHKTQHSYILSVGTKF